MKNPCEELFKPPESSDWNEWIHYGWKEVHAAFYDVAVHAFIIAQQLAHIRNDHNKVFLSNCALGVAYKAMGNIENAESVYRETRRWLEEEMQNNGSS